MILLMFTKTFFMIPHVLRVRGLQPSKSLAQKKRIASDLKCCKHFASNLLIAEFLSCGVTLVLTPTPS